MSWYLFIILILLGAVGWAQGPRSAPVPPAGSGRFYTRPAPVGPNRRFSPPVPQGTPRSPSKPVDEPGWVTPNSPSERGASVNKGPAEGASLERAPLPPPRPKRLVVEEPAVVAPAAHVSLDRLERQRVQNWADSIVELTVECQLDVLDRYSLCDLDRHAREKAGTLHKLSLPYQIGYGKLKLLRAHAEALKKLTSSNTTDAETLIAAKYTEFQLRLSGMSWLLEEVSSRSKRNFLQEYNAFWQDMDLFQGDWIPESLSFQQREKQLWNLLWADLKVWVENAPFVASRVTPKRKVLIETELPLVKQILEERVESQSVARLAARSMMKIAAEYHSISGTAEESLGVRKEFDAFTFFLGANENVLDYATALLR